MKYIALLLMIVVVNSCITDPATPMPNCDGLKQGLLDSNVSLIQSSLGKYIDMNYSRDNLNVLADTLTKSCDVIAIACFECIQTLPPQSEIGFAFVDYKGDSTFRELGISYTTDNKIKLVSVQ